MCVEMGGVCRDERCVGGVCVEMGVVCRDGRCVWRSDRGGRRI